MGLVKVLILLYGLFPIRNTEAKTKTEFRESYGISRTVKIISFDENGYSFGGGVVFKGKLVLTTPHIFQSKYTELLFDTGNDFIPVEIISSDTFKDLAILKIPGKSLHPSFIFSDDYRVGDVVFIVGHNNNTDWNTYTTKIISINKAKTQLGHTRTVLTLQNPVNIDVFDWHGLSGCPVINKSGFVVGVVEMSDSERGYAIGAKEIMEFIDIHFPHSK